MIDPRDVIDPVTLLAWDEVCSLSKEDIEAMYQIARARLQEHQDKAIEEGLKGFRKGEIVVIGAAGMPNLGKAYAAALAKQEVLSNELTWRPSDTDFFYGNLKHFGKPDWQRQSMRIVKGRGHNKHKGKKK